NHNVRCPLPLACAVVDAGLQKQRIIPVCRGRPRYQGHQQNTGAMLTKPQTQGVFFVPDEITTLSFLTAASPSVSSASTVLSVRFFLYALVAAGKSVESMIATVFGKPAHCANIGSSRRALMPRNFIRSKRSRN